MNKQKMTPFEQALLDASLEEFADIPDNEDEINVTFSPVFTAKAEKLVRNTQRKSWRYVNTAMKRAALVAAIAALLVSTAMAIPAVREEVIRFFIREQGTHIAVAFDPKQAANAPECIETVYVPTYVPEGYQEDTRSASTSAVCAIWHDDSGNSIVYHQLPVSDDPSKSDQYGVHSEGAKMQMLYLNGYRILSIYDDNVASYVWTDHEYFYDLSCCNTVPQNEMMRIFASIAVDEDAAIEGAQ